MKQRDKERYRIYDQNARNQKSKTFYDSREWQLTRSDILSACGIDVYVYMTEGVILAADTVHHIIPLKEAWDKRCDKQNLMPLHHDTHSKIEQMYKKERPVMEKKLAKMLVDFYTQTGLFSSAERMYVNSDYIESVLNNGGIPMAIPAVAMKADPEGILAVCDGILVPGGEDLNPWYYGEEPKPQIQTIRPEIDEAWFALGRAAKEMGMPMLGICKGIQFLNVLCGGDLYQDIYTQKETTILHLQSLERSYLHHHVEIKEGTHLAEILGAGTHAVNSMHHQAVRTPGEDIVVSATAPDGTIEAIESRNGQIVAVQWHPEGLIHSAPEMNRLFADLVERSSRYREKR